MRTALGLAFDAAFICLFAVVGRLSHGETGALPGVVATAWPFLAGMTAGWLGMLVAFRRVPLQVRDGIPVWVCVVAIGMALRALTGAGTSVAFVVVATLILGTMLLGWRAATRLTTRRRA
jgi:hypothetical protein